MKRKEYTADVKIAKSKLQKEEKTFISKIRSIAAVRTLSLHITKIRLIHAEHKTDVTTPVDKREPSN